MIKKQNCPSLPFIFNLTFCIQYKKMVFPCKTVVTDMLNRFHIFVFYLLQYLYPIYNTVYKCTNLICYVMQ